MHTSSVSSSNVLEISDHSSFLRLKRITSWIITPQLTSSDQFHWPVACWWQTTTFTNGLLQEAILHHKHPLTRLIIRSEHLRLLHAGPTLLMVSLNKHYHILRCRSIVRSITPACITCRKLTTRPSPQITGQLPTERLKGWS